MKTLYRCLDGKLFEESEKAEEYETDNQFNIIRNQIKCYSKETDADGVPIRIDSEDIVTNYLNTYYITMSTNGEICQKFLNLLEENSYDITGLSTTAGTYYYNESNNKWISIADFESDNSSYITAKSIASNA